MFSVKEGGRNGVQLAQGCSTARVITAEQDTGPAGHSCMVHALLNLGPSCSAAGMLPEWDLLGVVDHAPAEGGGAGGDLQAREGADGGSCEAVHAVGAELHAATVCKLVLQEHAP